MHMPAKRHRIDLASALSAETLVRRSLLEEIGEAGQLRITPNLNVIKLGGHGVIDYGRTVMHPLCAEIGELSRTAEVMVVTGGGARVRHIMEVGIDLGMPTGVLAELSAKISEQNAIMVAILLSAWGGTRIHTSDLLEVPALLRLDQLPVTHGTPPYGLYEHPARIGAVPPHRTDTGAFLIAEVLGARSCILAKNVDGLFTADPVVNPDAELIREIRADEVIGMNLDDLVLERMVLDLMQEAVNIREIRIVNCHVAGNVTAAVRGERVGTLIRA
ncbi:MAG TPA: uridylate kinase [Methanoregulaceae archaeon]|nr:uridylate kinase [Methanoregulaceae archaeon]HQJ88327.1 uridylate kinase [Methanoregulaceae archaeon]